MRGVEIPDALKVRVEGAPAMAEKAAWDLVEFLNCSGWQVMECDGPKTMRPPDDTRARVYITAVRLTAAEVQNV